VALIGACFTGALNSIREIVKERPIYTRERAAGLSSGAYMWSKLLVLGVLSALQATLMTVIGLAGRPLPPQGSLIKRLVRARAGRWARARPGTCACGQPAAAGAQPLMPELSS
jgi:ABC-2 type transporter